MNYGRPAIVATVVAGLAASMALPSAAAAAPRAKAAAHAYLAKAAAARSLCAPPDDTVGPAITKVTFGRASVDLDSNYRVQTVAVTAQDSSGKGDASGVNHVFLEVQGKYFYKSVGLKLTSGTAVGGKWTGSFVVSKFAHAGTYSIGYLTASDAAGNYQEYDNYGKIPYSPNSLSLHPELDPSFAVTGTPAKHPPRKPAGKLTDFTVGPTSVDTTDKARTVHYTATFSGPQPTTVWVYLNSLRSKAYPRYLYLREVRLTNDHGIWRGAATIPRWIGDRTLLTNVYPRFSSKYKPTYGNYSATKLKKLGFAHSIKVVSGVDKSKPTLTALSFQPKKIDSTTGDEQVKVVARATDVGSGVKTIFVSGGIENGINGVDRGYYQFAAAGIGYLSSNYFRVTLKRTSGGFWTGTTTVKQCVPSGTYKLSASVQDAAGNYHGYSTASLAKAKLPSTIDVTSKHGDIVAPYIYSAATYGADSDLFLNFSEGVENVTTSTLTVYPLTPASDRYTTTSEVTSIVCANGKMKVDCSGSGGLITSAVLTIPSMEPGDEYQVFANLNQVTNQLTDGNGNPLDWNYSRTQVKDS